MTGTLYCVGVGPGDPELMTLKAARIIAQAPAYAFFAKQGRPGNAYTIATAHLRPSAAALRFEYPFTTERPATDPAYVEAMTAFYDASAEAIAAHLQAGADVALLCEGDPFFYGSAMYLFDRLAGRHPAVVVPGIPAMAGCWAQAGVPMAHGDDVLTVLPGTLDAASLATRLTGTDAAVIMKVGRNLPKIRAALAQAGRLSDAVYVERGTMAEQRIISLCERPDAPAPYFALVLVPGRQRAR